MDRLSAEKRLSISYLLTVIGGATTSISTGIAWGHWYRTLDQCVDRNCSCIIYAQHTQTIFLGGEQAPCIWTVFGPLFYVFFSACLLCFHGYRVLFATKSPRMRSSRSMLAKMDPGGSIHIETVSQEMTSPLASAFWITTTVYTAIFTIYSLVHFGIYIGGYYRTCNQYRYTLEQHLRIHGTALSVIYNRLSCQGVFDFMDYMQRDTGTAYRDGIINTGLSLIIGISTSFISSVSFFFASFLNVKLSRNNDAVIST